MYVTIKPLVALLTVATCTHVAPLESASVIVIAGVVLGARPVTATVTSVLSGGVNAEVAIVAEVVV
jgi:hypothetical protein